MASKAKYEAYKRIVALILEEIDGCNLSPVSSECIELLKIAKEMTGRAENHQRAMSRDDAKDVEVESLRAANRAQWKPAPINDVAIDGNPPKPPWL